VAFLLLVCFIAGLPNTVLRTQIIAYPLFGLVLLLLLTDEQRPSRRVYLVFPLLVLWANVHGSVVLGAGLVALRGATFAAASLRRRAPTVAWLPRAAVLVVAPWACTLASPYGLALPGYYHGTLGNGSLSHFVAEWGPSTIRNQPALFVLLLLAAWLVFGHGRGLGAFARLSLLLAGIGGLLAIRNVVWFALVAAAVLPSALDAAWRPRPAVRHLRINLLLAGVAALAFVVAASAMAGHKRAWFERDFPPRAGNVLTAAAAADPSLRVFANERYADWLLFEHPSLSGRVAYDIRFELLRGSELHRLYDFATQNGPDWQSVAAGFSLLVLDPAHERGVIDYYIGRRHASTLFRDKQAVVLRVPTR
jgi:hypothetical protein